LWCEFLLPWIGLPVFSGSVFSPGWHYQAPLIAQQVARPRPKRRIRMKQAFRAQSLFFFFLLGIPALWSQQQPGHWRLVGSPSGNGAKGALTARIEPAESGVESGGSVQMKAIVSGGSPPYSYEWHNGEQLSKITDGNITWSNLNRLGDRDIRVIVRDAAGNTVEAHAAIHVHAGEPTVTVQIAPEPPSTEPANGGGGACSIAGDWVPASNGALVLSLRQNGSQVQGKLDSPDPYGRPSTSTPASGSLSGRNLHLTIKSPEGDITLDGGVSADCGTLNLTARMKDQSQAMTFHRP
jgi:hypothetical protein